MNPPKVKDKRKLTAERIKEALEHDVMTHYHDSVIVTDLRDALHDLELVGTENAEMRKRIDILEFERDEAEEVAIELEKGVREAFGEDMEGNKEGDPLLERACSIRLDREKRQATPEEDGCWYPKGVGLDIFGVCGECPYCLAQAAPENAS